MVKFFKADKLSGEREEIDAHNIVAVTDDGQELLLSAPSDTDGIVGLCIMGRLMPIRIYPYAANKIIVKEGRE